MVKWLNGVEFSWLGALLTCIQPSALRTPGIRVPTRKLSNEEKAGKSNVQSDH